MRKARATKSRGQAVVMADRYEAIIIGAGAAGGTLAGSGRKILLAERGKPAPARMR
jgi:choline dehydrogenase-like flavoprotein